nr:hypothetical protein [Tanacetum cinerariifolium]
MSRDVLTVGSTMTIPLLYRGEYSQWVERFMNYLEEQTDGKAMINSIKNGDQPLPRVTQVSIARTTSTEQPPLKDKSMWSDQEKRVQKIDRLAISLLIYGLPNDIYSLIDNNKTAKDLWDALARHMLGFEYGEQDRKATVFYFEKAKDLRSTLYDEKVIGLGYTPMFLTHFDEALEIEKFKRSRENKIEFAYDYGILNASYVNEKINLEDDYFQVIINLDFDKIDSPFQQTSSLKPYVPNVILKKIIIDLEDEVINLLEKEKANLETIESLKSKGFDSSENVSS